MPSLVALFGPKRGLRIDLDRNVTAGRSSAAELQLIDGKVSREHCRFEVLGGEVRLTDLGSHNGTYVNGERLTAPRALVAGDEIAVGDSLLLFAPAFEVLAARFGEATLVVSGLGATGSLPLARPVGADSASREPGRSSGDAAGAMLLGLARRLAAIRGPAAATVLLEALASNLGLGLGQLLGGDGAGRGLRIIAGFAGVGGQGGGAGLGGRAPLLGRATLALCVRERRSVQGDGQAGELTARAGRSAVGTRPSATLLAPITVGDEVRGFVYIERTRAFTPDEVALVEACGALAALHGLGGALGLPAETSLAPTASPGDPSEPGDPVGVSAAFRRVIELAHAAARAPSTVLITGPSGSGKEELARLIHRRSARAAGPFVAVNCGALVESLAPSQLFGHERGAFTGAQTARDGCFDAADGGTLFLDEVGDLSLAVQVQLLRVLQERVFFRVGSNIPRPVDVRVVAATHKPLEAEVQAGRFREDLFYRLNVLRLALPSLRERPEDVGPLAAALLARHARALGRPNPGLTTQAIALLARAEWRGNARELGNVLERALVLREPGASGPLTEEDVAPWLVEGTPTTAPASATSPSIAPVPGLAAKVEELERREILGALRAARGVKARAARALGISRPTLDKKIADLGIDAVAPRLPQDPPHDPVRVPGEASPTSGLDEDE